MLQSIASLLTMKPHFNQEKQKPTLLLADAHRMFTDAIHRVLKEQFDVVGVAHDGMELLSLAREFDPDLILTEYYLPNKNGFEVLEVLRREKKSFRAIYLTSCECYECLHNALISGAEGYMRKNASIEDLLDTIDQVLGGERVYPGVGLKRAGEKAAVKKALDQVVGDDLLGSLTKRQREVLHLAAEGHSLKEIVAILGVSRRTVELHKYAMMKKLGMRNSSQIIRFAVRNGFISL